MERASIAANALATINGVLSWSADAPFDPTIGLDPAAPTGTTELDDSADGDAAAFPTTVRVADDEAEAL